MDISRPCAPLVSNSILTMSITCFAATLAALILLPVLILWRLTMTPQQKARYYVRQQGWSQRKTAQFLGISRYAVRRALLA